MGHELGDQPDLELTAAPLALKESDLVGASSGDNRHRSWLVALDPRPVRRSGRR